MNDAVLLERWVQRRDAEAFNEIVTRFADQVYGTCRNILRNDADAEEVAQECFLLLVRSGDDVRTSLGGWLHRAATTKSLDRIRGESRRRRHEQIHAEGAPRHIETTWDDLQEHVDAAIDTLPEDLREAVVAHFIGRKNHGEIALELRLTRRAVSYRIQRGVEALRSELVRRGVTVSCAGLGALLLAQAIPAAPLSLTASLGKLALAAGLPSGTGASATTTANAAGSLILMKTKLFVAVAVVCVAAGVYFATRSNSPQPPLDNSVASPVETRDGGEGLDRSPVDNSDMQAETTLASATDTGVTGDESVTEEHRGVVTGIVLLPTGQPAQGATVRYGWKPNIYEPPVRGMAEHESQPVETNQHGQFSFGQVPRGRIAVTAVHGDGLAIESTSVESRAATRDLTLVLKGGESIAGVVVSRDGSAVAGSRVTPLSLGGEKIRDYESDGRTVISDKDGGFAVPHLKPGEWMFRASADGFGSVQAGPFKTGATNARIVLAPGVDLACNTVGADSGKPVKNVSVIIKRQDERSVLTRATSDEKGAATFASLGEGSYTLDVEDARYALDGPPLPVVLERSGNLPLVTLEVVEGGRIRGRVYDTITGNGVPNVVVTAASSDAKRTAVAAPTADDGSYVLTGLATDDYRMFTRKLPPVYSRELPDAPQSVSVTEGRTVDAVDFPLSPGASLGGIVLDVGGAPVPGAQVFVKSETKGFVLGDLYTQEDGRFAVGDFEAGESIVLSANSNAANSGHLGPFVAGDPGSDAIEVVLSKECTGAITGRVTDPQGRPFPCQLQARADEPELQFPVKGLLGEVDGLGNFVLAGACAGTYTIEIVPERTARQTSAPIRVETGQIVSGINLVYDPGQLFEIAGIVVDEEENPVAGASVSANAQFASPMPAETTDENGAFHFKDLPAGRYMLQARAEGYDAMQSMGIAEAGDMDAVVRLPRAPIISGRVTDAQGRPVANYLVSLFVVAENVPPEPRFQKRISDENGAFSLECSANMTWHLRVEAEGYVTAELEVGSARIGREVSDVEVVLESAQ